MAEQSSSIHLVPPYIISPWYPLRTQYLHRCSVVLVFITTLVSALLVTALVSWLSVATFWLSLAHTQPRLDTEHEVVTSGIMIS